MKVEDMEIIARISAGEGQDEDMSARGDFQFSIHNAIKHLKERDQKGPFIILSNSFVIREACNGWHARSLSWTYIKTWDLPLQFDKRHAPPRPIFFQEKLLKKRKDNERDSIMRRKDIYHWNINDKISNHRIYVFDIHTKKACQIGKCSEIEYDSLQGLDPYDPLHLKLNKKEGK